MYSIDLVECYLYLLYSPKTMLSPKESKNKPKAKNKQNNQTKPYENQIQELFKLLINLFAQGKTLLVCNSLPIP